MRFDARAVRARFGEVSNTPLPDAIATWANASLTH